MFDNNSGFAKRVVKFPAPEKVAPGLGKLSLTMATVGKPDLQGEQVECLDQRLILFDREIAYYSSIQAGVAKTRGNP